MLMHRGHTLERRVRDSGQGSCCVSQSHSCQALKNTIFEAWMDEDKEGAEAWAEGEARLEVRA